MKIKTAELTGAALDFAVAKCEGMLPASFDDWKQTWPHYSTNWAQGGPIIDREKMVLEPAFGGGWAAHKRFGDAGPCRQIGPTPLIAAMRCRVAAHLGDEVGVPQELLT